MDTQDKVVYLPPILDPKKVHEGLVEIINFVEGLEPNKKSSEKVVAHA